MRRGGALVETSSEDKSLNPWKHDHAFGQDAKKPGEVRTLIVVLLTATTMVLEIGAGVIYGSMALLADGLHMASHATALAIAMFAYVYARRRAHDDRFSFGTGKVNSLAGFAGAILLALFALMMVWESASRLLHPVTIAFNQALVVAVLGFVVNGLSVFILGHSGLDEQMQGGAEQEDHDHPHGHDHNLRSAYLHVLADTLTSVLAIAALLAGKYAGLYWLDPAMGVVGAALVARWSAGLLRTTSHVLLDRQVDVAKQNAIRDHVSQQGDEVADLHYWAVAPGKYALVLAVVSDRPDVAEKYRSTLAAVADYVHLNVEVYRRSDSNKSDSSASAADA
jgi:cation diffusion facilitator family transporter